MVRELLQFLEVKDRTIESYASTCPDSKTSRYALAFLVGAVKELLKSGDEPAAVCAEKQCELAIRCSGVRVGDWPEVRKDLWLQETRQLGCPSCLLPQQVVCLHSNRIVACT